MKEFNAILKALSNGSTVLIHAYGSSRIIHRAYLKNNGAELYIYTTCGKSYTASAKYVGVKVSESQLLLRGNTGHKLLINFMKEDNDAYEISLGLTLLD